MRTIKYIALTALALASIPAPGHAQTRPLTPQQQRARDVFRQMIEINTSDSVGSVTAAAEAIAQRFRAAGFPAADVQILTPPGKPTKGNLVVRYRGRAGSTLKPVLLLAHLDVVAAKRTDWSRDPFTFGEDSVFFYGRGIADDKAMASIFVANLLQMKEQNYTPNRDIILALTADEEGGSANGVDWLVKNHRSLIDAAYAINEGGGGALSASGTPVYNGVQAAEKVSVHYTMTATNPGGHSSVPRPDNAIYQLASALLRISQYAFPVALNDVTRGYFAETARVDPTPEVAAAMRAIANDGSDSAAIRTLSAIPQMNSIMRTTCVATRLSGGHANNALPQTATANINCRIVPTSNGTETLAALKRVVADTGIAITWNDAGAEKFGVTPSPIPAELLTATKDITKRMFGDAPVIPMMGTGATDGRFLRASGIPTYGVSGLFSVPGETNAHGRDEKIRVKSYYNGLSFLDQLVRRVTGAPCCQ